MKIKYNLYLLCVLTLQMLITGDIYAQVWNISLSKTYPYESASQSFGRSVSSVELTATNSSATETWTDFHVHITGSGTKLKIVEPGGSLTSPIMDFYILNIPPGSSFSKNFEIINPNNVNYTLNAYATPEPSTILLLGIGAIGIGYAKRRKARSVV